MVLFFYIYYMEELKSVCTNVWCKATFVYREENMIDGIPPKMCPKCFKDAPQVTWTDKKYENEDSYQGSPVMFSYKIKKWY